jgi:hypothetical protein
MIFTVDYETWAQAGRSRDEVGYTQLLNDKGFRCCLGFAARDCGIPDIKMLIAEYPEDLELDHYPDARNTFIEDNHCNNEFTIGAVDINDDITINLWERVAKLQAHAKEHGHEFVFINLPEGL